MNFFWIIAAAQAAYVMVSIHTGELNLSGWRTIERAEQPELFRFYMCGMTADALIAAGAALSASLSN